MGKAHHMAKEDSRVLVYAPLRTKPEEGRVSPTVTAQKQMENIVHSSMESRVRSKVHARFGKGGGGNRIKP